MHLITLNDKHKLGRTHPDEGSARRRYMYLTAHNTHKRQTFMPPAGFEPAIPASKRPQIYVFRRRDYRDRSSHYLRHVTYSVIYDLNPQNVSTQQVGRKIVVCHSEPPPPPRVLHVSITHTPSLDEMGGVRSTHETDQLIYRVLLISVLS